MEEFEIGLFSAESCDVYKIPPRPPTAAGYNAEAWAGGKIWTGKCKVVAKGDICEVRLESVAGEMFATCPVRADETAKAVQGVTDSGRYFVLRVQDGQGRHAFIGLGFEERSEAFDFKVSITDFKNQVERMKKAESDSLIKASDTDYSLKSGEKIKVNLAGKNKVDTAGAAKKQEANQAFASAGLAPVAPTGGIAPPMTGGLAPPSGGGKKAAYRAKGSSPQAQAPAPVGAYSAPTPTTAPPAPAPQAKQAPADIMDLF